MALSASKYAAAAIGVGPASSSIVLQMLTVSDETDLPSRSLVSGVHNGDYHIINFIHISINPPILHHL